MKGGGGKGIREGVRDKRGNQTQEEVFVVVAFVGVVLLSLGLHRLPLWLLLSSLSLTLLSLSWLHARLEIVRGGNSDQRRDDKKPLTRRGIRHEKGRRRWRHLEQRERRQYWTELDNDICNRKSVKL